MSQPVLECVNPWQGECICGASHMPCWPRPDTSCCDRLNPTNPTAEQTAQIERILQVSAEIIWRLSGKQFGACPVTVRPCRKTCARGFTGYWSDIGWMPVLENGVWFNQNCDRCRPSGCSCSELCEVDLPGPVVEVLSVTLDGIVRPSSEYRVDDFRRLVRVGELTPVEGVFNANETTHVATLGTLTVTGWTSVNVSQWLTVLWPTTTLTVTGQVGDTITILVAPNDEVSFPAGWTVEELTPGGTLTPGNYVAGGNPPAPNFNLKFTLTAGNLSGSIVGTQHNPTSLGFSALAGSSAEMMPACWPTCQEMAAPLTDDGTWGVTYRRGAVVPQSGLWAAGLLACELYKACTGEGECALPSNAQRIARQGVTVELTPVLVKPGEFATGIPEVDLWLNSVNPYRAKLPSAVFSPDRPAPVMTTWPCA
jgi:hypothetical protein